MSDQNQTRHESGQANSPESLQQDLAESKTRIKVLLNSISDAVVIADLDGTIETYNSAAQILFGYSADEVLGKSVTRLMTPFDADRFDKYVERFLKSGSNEIISQGPKEVIVGHKDGSSTLVELTLAELSSDNKRLFMAAMKDINDRGPSLEDIHKIADHDPLTELYNYNYLKMELGRVMERRKRGEGNPSALIYINIDRFKFINDTMGLDAGDCVLVTLGKKIKLRLRGSDMAARLSGDEFAVLIYNTTQELAEYVGNEFHKFITKDLITYEGKNITLRCSIGVTLIDGKADTLGDVLNNAMDACKRAKNLGGNSVMISQ